MCRPKMVNQSGWCSCLWSMREKSVFAHNKLFYISPLWKAIGHTNRMRSRHVQGPSRFRFWQRPSLCSIRRSFSRCHTSVLVGILRKLVARFVCCGPIICFYLDRYFRNASLRWRRWFDRSNKRALRSFGCLFVLGQRQMERRRWEEARCRQVLTHGWILHQCFHLNWWKRQRRISQATVR